MRASTSTRNHRPSVVATVLGVLLPVLAPATASAACIGSGTDQDIQAVLKAHDDAELCQGAVFDLYHPIVFMDEGQQIFTTGFPTNNKRALLRIASPSITTAIDGGGVINGDHQGVNRAKIRNIRVHGGRPAYGYLHDTALIEMGGKGVTAQLVEYVKARHTRSWSTVHVFGRKGTCSGVKVRHNDLGPAGQPWGGTWADGISLSCPASRIVDNTITDATDGAIVIFGAPGSVVRDNTIIARNRQLLGGINMVDYEESYGDFTGTVVSNNVISAEGAFIKIGIAMGPRVWSCATDTNYGAEVTGNTLMGLHFGYGYVIDGVSDWTFTGNISLAAHGGNPSIACNSSQLNHAPAAFIKHGIHATGTFQGSFVEGLVHGGTTLSPPN